MTRLVVLILLVGSFLGGYYLGHLENSPDVFGWLGGAYAKAARTGEDLADGSARDLDPGRVIAEPVTIDVDGRQYIIGQKYESELAERSD